MINEIKVGDTVGIKNRSKDLNFIVGHKWQTDEVNYLDVYWLETNITGNEFKKFSAPEAIFVLVK